MTDKNEDKRFYEKGVYAITINPSDPYQFNGSADRLIKFRKAVHDKLCIMTPFGIEYFLYVELSEPSYTNAHMSFPRLHMHGFIRFKCNKAVKMWLLQYYYHMQSWANLCIKRCTDIGKWIEYCTKQRDIMGDEIITNDDTMKEKIITAKPVNYTLPSLEEGEEGRVENLDVSLRGAKRNGKIRDLTPSTKALPKKKQVTEKAVFLHNTHEPTKGTGAITTGEFLDEYDD